jgi:uncharacterized membrane protein YfhO
MSVTPHKYWRVTIDGVETEAVGTNVGYQGVAVPAGRHAVEMEYRNPLVAVGAAVSLIALLVLALFSMRHSSIRHSSLQGASASVAGITMRAL